MFGGTAATSVVVANSTTITATTPAGSAGAVTVTVTVSGLSGGLTNGYTYVVAPTVTNVSPNNGSTAGGTAVTITGDELCVGRGDDIWRYVSFRQGCVKRKSDRKQDYRRLD